MTLVSSPVCSQKDEADIFFLIDDSESIEDQDFDEMKDFIIEFLNPFNIGPDHVRVGLVKFGDVPTLEFDLTAWSNADEVKNAVRSVIHEKSGTKTGRALSSMDEHFRRAESTRGHKVPEYLIVITDGKSNDAVSDPARRLRDQDIMIYAVGVKESVTSELEEIAGDPKRAVFVNNFDALKSIKELIVTDICVPDGEEK